MLNSEPIKPIKTGPKSAQREPTRNAKGQFLPGVAQPGSGRPRKLKILEGENREMVINKALGIIQEGQDNPLYKDVLLKLIDKVIPSLKATELNIDNGSSNLGVIVLPSKKPLDVSTRPSKADVIEEEE